MATQQRRFDPSARTLAAGSVVAVLFGIGTVVGGGGPALTTVGVLAVIIGVVALLLAVGRYLED
jgi:hypothetical protein